MNRQRRLVPTLLAGFLMALPPAGSAVRADEALPPLGQAPDESQGELEEFRARGVLEPADEAVLSAELDARITALPFEEGQRFEKGDALVRFDCGLYEARLASAQSEREVARLQYESDKQLARLNSIGDLELHQSAARLRKADADVRTAELLAQRCTIAAPYDGRVVKRLAHAQESVPAGRELVEIVGTGTPDIRLIVPSNWLAWLKPSQRFTFTVDETGARRQARVEVIGARIDAVSQTLPVIATFDAADGGDASDLLAGMSGTADFGEVARRAGAGSSQ